MTQPYSPQPMQPIVLDDNKVVRFRSNAIVRHLLDRLQDRHNYGLNQIAQLPFSQEDREQFAQLIGYSICGYHELDYVSDESAAQASALAGQVEPGAGGCRDAGCSIHGGPLYDDDGRRIA